KRLFTFLRKPCSTSTEIRVRLRRNTQKYRAAILIHGCFWHAHDGCKYFSIPASNEQFWRTKLSANRERDTRQIDALRSQGWRVLVIWECATRSTRHREDLLAWTMKWLVGSDEYGEIPLPLPQSP
ncbi:very short patch repair endonuclease, partial [Burkholderia contaminans]|nr:hypothetical protein [Burkholderia contaminans]MBA9868074.1 hypothetical protein [Burkholderia contaminans]MBA9910762.1 hypothetical protein [Burkholderia contaminans]MBX3846792.1 very short patch repair endonuclease [Burkholderia contaminans]MBX3865106.1 very short patch repair endonuclease [Burkholderia contaminans]